MVIYPGNRIDDELPPAAMTDSDTGESALVLKGVSMKGKVAGLMLDMQITQRYKNERRKEIETVYTFPVPYRATLLDIEMKIGEEILKGAVVEKYAARKGYEEAVENGDLPVLVEETGSGLYTANIGNIKPGEEIEVTIRYASVLDVEQGHIRLGVPTCLAPRYGDPVAQGGIASHECVSSNILAKYPLKLEIELFGAVAMGRAYSPTNRIGLGIIKNGGIRVTLEDAWLDRDFVLDIEEVPFEGAAALGQYKNESSVLASFMPKINPEKSASANIKVLVDCSGSMQGPRIESAVNALSSLVDALGAEDRMSLSCFGSNYVNYHESTKCCDANHKANLKRLVAGIGANMGGTEMQSALRSLTNDVAKGGAEFADILLITDGEVWAAEEMKNLALSSGHRIYTIGVGCAPNEQMLRAMSEGTGGMSRIVSDGEDMSRAVLELVAGMRQEFASDVRIDWHGEPLWQSPIPKSIFNGQTVHAFARFAKTPEAAPTLSFRVGEKNYSFDAEGPQLLEGDAISRFAGSYEYRDFVAGRDFDGARDAALKYGIVTRDTSLYLVKIRNEEEKSSGMPVLEQIQQMMPADAMADVCVDKCCLEIDCCTKYDSLGFDEDVCELADQLEVCAGRENDFVSVALAVPEATNAAAAVKWPDLSRREELEESDDADDWFTLYACLALYDRNVHDALIELAKAADEEHEMALAILVTLIRRGICAGVDGSNATQEVIRRADDLGITPVS